MNHTRLSKTLSHMLRHAPEAYDVTLVGGWVNVKDAVEGIRGRVKEFKDLNESDLLDMIQNGGGGRFEVADGRVRALYGHSLQAELERSPSTPPEVLYHGTTQEAAQEILRVGIKPMSRQQVHMGASRDEAFRVGHRHSKQPIILVVEAGRAHQAGIQFYPGNGKVWTADVIPPEFVRLETDG